MKEKSKSYYDELGVSPDATNEEIRQAFRRKAKGAHPDRPGGSHEAMAQVNRAYETLSSPSRRISYDRTGDDQPAPIDAKARDKLVGMMSNWLVSDQVGSDMMVDITRMLVQEASNTRNQVSQCTQLVVKMRRRLKKLKTKGGKRSMILDMLAYNIGQIHNNKGKLEDQLAITEATIELSKDFEYEQEPMPAGNIEPGLMQFIPGYRQT